MQKYINKLQEAYEAENANVQEITDVTDRMNEQFTGLKIVLEEKRSTNSDGIDVTLAYESFVIHFENILRPAYVAQHLFPCLKKSGEAQHPIEKVVNDDIEDLQLDWFTFVPVDVKELLKEDFKLEERCIIISAARTLYLKKEKEFVRDSEFAVYSRELYSESVKEASEIYQLFNFCQ